MRLFFIPVFVLLCLFNSSKLMHIYAQNKIFQSGVVEYVQGLRTDKNNINLLVNNRGKSYMPFTQSGGFWQIPGEQFSRGIIFDQAPWIIGKRNGEIILSGGQWLSAYSPGPIINGQAAMLIHPEDSLRYRVYKINKGDNNTNPDYAEWPVEFGAPVNNQGQPLVLGDQTLWTCYNYLDSNLTYPFNPFNKINPIEIEIHQTVFLKEGSQTDYEDIFSNVIFIEYEIIYKGNDPIDSAYFGFWTDIDFEPPFENRPAVDVQLNLGYCWTGEDTLFNGAIPLSVGYTLLYGPVKPAVGNTAIFKGRNLADYQNIELSSFHGIGYDSFNDSSFTYIQSMIDAWNYARGLNKNGNNYIDPTNNQQTNFPLSGDPVTNSGWIFQDNSTAGEAGVMLFAGPFNFAQNDTQWTMLALVPGLGNSNLNSISAMREKVEILRSLAYDSLAFGSTSYAITDIKSEENLTPEHYSLNQNYPNPFNPSTKISWQSPVNGHQKLKIYDVLGNEVATLVNEFRNAGSYETEFNATSLSSGVYFYQLKAGDFVETKKMILMK